VGKRTARLVVLRMTRFRLQCNRNFVGVDYLGALLVGKAKNAETSATRVRPALERLTGTFGPIRSKISKGLLRLGVIRACKSA